MSLMGGELPAAMSTSALLLNLLVAGIAWLTFWRMGHGSWSLLWPFAVSSVPAAFVGGWLPVSAQAYRWLLAGCLLIAAWRLCLPACAAERSDAAGRPVASPARAARSAAGGGAAQTGLPSLREETRCQAPPLAVAFPLGGLIGAIAGIVGVGGGIFLSPLMALLRWADMRRTAAVSAAFIVVNSLAGLSGRLISGQLLVGSLTPLVAVAFAGGIVGSRLGATRFSGFRLRRLLAVVLVVATGKLVVRHGPTPCVGLTTASPAVERTECFSGKTAAPAAVLSEPPGAAGRRRRWDG
jgi:uncharacterized membrane protein YfcA